MEASSNLQAKHNGPPVNFVTRKPIGGLDVNQMPKLPPRDGPIGTVDGRPDIRDRKLEHFEQNPHNKVLFMDDDGEIQMVQSVGRRINGPPRGLNG